MFLSLIFAFENPRWWDYPGFELWKFVNLAIFVIVLVVVMRKFFGVPQMYRNRKETIRAELEKARAEAYTQTEAQRADAMKERQQKLNEMRAQLTQTIAREKKTIEQQASEAHVTLEAESRRLAREIGSRVLSRPLNDAEMS